MIARSFSGENFKRSSMTVYNMIFPHMWTCETRSHNTAYSRRGSVHLTRNTRYCQVWRYLHVADWEIYISSGRNYMKLHTDLLALLLLLIDESCWEQEVSAGGSMHTCANYKSINNQMTRVVSCCHLYYIDVVLFSVALKNLQTIYCTTFGINTSSLNLRETLWD